MALSVPVETGRSAYRYADFTLARSVSWMPGRCRKSCLPMWSCTCARTAFRRAGRLPRQWKQDGARILVREVPCSGKMDGQYLFHALEGGGARLCVVACPKGECHLAQGNYRAEIRVRTVQRLLAEIGLEPERAELVHCSRRRSARATRTTRPRRGRADLCPGRKPASRGKVEDHEQTSHEPRRNALPRGKPILLAEISPPQGADPAPLRAAAKRCAGKVHAVGISDNRERVSMSALAAASLVAGEGLEPILHVTTRDRNRIALVSEALGAQALGIRNLLCTSGTHQTLGRFRAAKNVYDVDSVQLLQTYRRPGRRRRAGGRGAASPAPARSAWAAVASPDADPLELQVAAAGQEDAAGAEFLITQPVFDLERFDVWWQEVTRRGIHEKVAILAGIQPLTERPAGRRAGRQAPAAEDPGRAARADCVEAATRPRSGPRPSRSPWRRSSGWRSFRGLRGFSICGDGDPDAALEIIEKSGLGSN